MKMKIFSELLGEQLIENSTDASINSTIYITTNELEGKTIGLYFSAHWCGPSRTFTLKLAEIYKSVYENIKDNFEIVFISSDRNENDFNGYYKQMLWKALPYADRNRANALSDKYEVRGIPCLVILSPDGQVIKSNCVNEVYNQNAAFFQPWSNVSQKMIEKIITTKTTITKTTTTTTVFSDLLGEKLLQHYADGNTKSASYINTSELEGKNVALYFAAQWCRPSRDFTVKLIEIYNDVYENIKNDFEIVFISWDNEESAFECFFKDMPWKALPFTDRTHLYTLNKKYEVKGIPCLIVFSSTGEVINSNGVEEVYKNGGDCFRCWAGISDSTYSATYVNQQEMIRTARNINTTAKLTTTVFSQLLGDRLLQSSHEECSQNPNYILTSELEGKTIALYFSAHWCGPSRTFTLKLVEVYRSVYEEIKDNFEIVFISSDENETNFHNYYKQMPWRALPFTDRTRSNTLLQKYNVKGIPCLIVLSSDGEIITSNGVQEITDDGANFFQRWSKIVATDSTKIMTTTTTMTTTASTKAAALVIETVFSQLFGDRLLQHSLDIPAHSTMHVKTSELEGKTIAIYFSANWCQASREFTIKLAEVYKNVYEEVKEKFEIIFISSDKDVNGFDNYYKGMPWKALPFYGNQNRVNALNAKYNVRHIPCLIVLSSAGQVITLTGVEEVHSKGVDCLRRWAGVNQKSTSIISKTIVTEKTEIPTTPKILQPTLLAGTETRVTAATFLTQLLGERLLQQSVDGRFRLNNYISTSDLEGKTIALYFSAEWCRSSQEFTTKLVQIYKNLHRDLQEKFEIIFISSDRGEKSFENYYKKMPWKALPFSDRSRWNALKTTYNVNAIPSLVVLTTTGQVLSSNAVSEINSKDIDCIRRWTGVFASKESTGSSQVHMQNNEGRTETLLTKDTSKLLDEKRYQKLNDKTIEQINERKLNEALKKSPKPKNSKKTTKKVVINEEKQILPPDRNRRLPRRQSKQCCLAVFAVACLAIFLITLLVLLYVFKLRPQMRQTIITDDKKDVVQEITLKAFFSTSYTLESKNESLKLENLEYLTDQLNNKFNETKIRVIKGFFMKNAVSKRFRKMKCENPLLGNILQLHLIASLFGQCADQSDICKLKLRQELKDDLKEHFILQFSIPNTIQLDDDSSTSINIKLCNVTDMEEVEIVEKSKRRKTTTISTTIENIDTATKFIVPNDPFCLFSPAKIKLVVMDGEDETRIHDEIQAGELIADYDDRRHQTVTLNEDSISLLRIQLDCTEEQSSDSPQEDCSHAHHIDVWIDLNDDGNFDEAENRVDHRSPNNGEMPPGTYDMQISIPTLDGNEIKSGSHRMRIRVIPNEDYVNKCGKSDYSETREYTVKIVQASKIDAVPTFITPVATSNPICGLRPANIIYVHMAGEQGTVIRDETHADRTNSDSEGIHYTSATLYEGTVNTMRIQLDCVDRSDGGAVNDICSLGHHIDVWIDLNNDGEFHDRENVVSHRSSIHDEMPQGTYDLQISIPTIDEHQIRGGSHRMRLRLVPSETYTRTCGKSDRSETREYTVNIIQNHRIDVAPQYIAPAVTSNPICASRAAKIMYIQMAGEQDTVIRDESLSEYPISDSERQKYISATLYENTVNTMRIQLDCADRSFEDSANDICSIGYHIDVWIDFNDDGQFRDEENVVSHRSSIHEKMPPGTYDLQISIPAIDENQIRGGPHRTRLRVIPSETYTRICGRSDFIETREYIINIIRMIRHEVPDVIQPPIREYSPCPINIARLMVVTMSGQQGTEIRDQLKLNYARNDPQSRHEATIIVYESSINVLRIQLDCTEHSRNDLHHEDCGRGYRVDVWIDLNDDGRFDEIESRVLHRSLIRGREPGGTYALEVCIPGLNGVHRNVGRHLMQLSLILSEEYRGLCDNLINTETRDYSINIVPRPTCEAPTFPVANTVIHFICSSNPAKIMLVLISGEQGTEIRDEISKSMMINHIGNQPHRIVTWFGDSIYHLQIQLDCSRQHGIDSLESDCSNSYHINVWIDFNDDGRFDSFESLTSQILLKNGDRERFLYDLKVFTPSIDHQNVKAGSYRMGLSVTRSEAYQRQCGNTDNLETREYTVKMIRRKTCTEDEYYDQPESDVIINLSTDLARHTYCSPGNLICSSGSNSIFSVKLSGEQNTKIHDEMKRCSTINNYDDRSQFVVQLFNTKIYILEVRLHCAGQAPTAVGTNCDMPHYLDVWIDLNNDGDFDDSNERFFHSNQLGDDYKKGYYDFRIVIPEIHEENIIDTSHKMRIVLVGDEKNRRPCNNVGYGEARDYTLQILRKP